MPITKRPLGRTGQEVTILGLGGEGVLRTFGRNEAASALINRALDLGIMYCESARAYSGSESYYGQALKERRKDVFLASKSHERTKHGALAHLHETLRNMETDHLDLWQVHDIREPSEIEELFGPNGALEAFVEAQQMGKTRFIGLTGHHDPAVIRACIERFPFDTVLMPVNPAEHLRNGFLARVLPAATERGMGIVGMKTFFRGFASRLPWYTSMEPFFRFALSQPVSTIVIGCDDLGQLEENVRFAETFELMSEEEQKKLMRDVGPLAQQLMYYRP
jgi:aryl-alcohol dehydrogenase-like predicted oxidoreductase